MAELEEKKSDCTALQNPRLHALLRYWYKKRGSRMMPSRYDIDPVEIPRLLPIVLLAEIDGDDARIRLMGMEATAGYGSEMRGRSIRDFDLEEFTASWIEAFQMAVKSSEPVVVAGMLIGGSRRRRVESVLMPMSDGEGAASHVLGGLVIKPMSPDEQVRPVPPVTHALRFAHRVADSAEDCVGSESCAGGVR